MKVLELKLGLPIEDSPIDYTSRNHRIRTFIVALWFLILGAAMYLPFWALHGTDIGFEFPSYMVAAVVLPFVIMLNSFNSDARERNKKAFGAVEDLVAANDAVISMINTCENEVLRRACRRTYTLLLRSIYCMAVGREFRVIFPSDRTSARFEDIMGWFAEELGQAGLAGDLLRGNSRLNAVLRARSAIKTITTIPIPKSMFVAVWVFFTLTYTTIALPLTVKVPPLFGMLFGAVFTYAIGLVILIARSRAVPYGAGRAEIEMHERFRLLEDKNATNLEAVRACRAAIQST